MPDDLKHIPILYIDTGDFAKYKDIPNKRFILKRLQKIVADAAHFFMPHGDVWTKWTRHGTGDGYYFFLDGLSAQVALEYALNIENQLKAHNEQYGRDLPIQLRMVLVVGDVELVVDQYLSDALTEAARFIDHPPFKTYLKSQDSSSVLAISALFHSELLGVQSREELPPSIADLHWTRFDFKDKHGFIHVGYVLGPGWTRMQETLDFREFELQLPGSRFFTKDTVKKATSFFQSGYLRKKTYGTFDTPYAVINEDLVRDIKTKIDTESFFVIYGNSGRGKTFFTFNLIRSIIELYDVIIYYSPHFRLGNDLNLDRFFDPVKKLLSSGYRVLFIMDDGHLVPDLVKNRFLEELEEHDNLSFLLVSRSKEDYSISSEYQQDKYFQNFNEVAEKLFDQIFKKFEEINKVSSQQIKEDIRRETDGANLVFLTVFLQSWADLLLQKRDVCFEDVRHHAYTTFCNFYERNHSDGWKYINHVVSALFQYEIRIDKNYLTLEVNKNLPEKGLREYLKDRMIHKRVTEENHRLFYVFMDFAKGEEGDMMKHASEFRFYLEAYGNNLVFGESRNLDRIEFTKMVLQDYCLFKPCNMQEVLLSIRSNSGKEERGIMLSHLYMNKKCNAIIDQSIEGIML